MLRSNGNPVSSLSAAALSSSPDSPKGKTVIAAYTLGPDGATFDLYLTLTLKYSTLAAGVAENTLDIYYYDGSQWQALNGTVNT
jgi:hypothetical protein